MKRNIFMYLFLFAALWIVFQYVNNTKVYESQLSKIEKLEAQSEAVDADIDSLNNRIFDAEYFTVNNNENAYSYFEEEGYVIDSLLPLIEDGIYAKNKRSGNSLVPFVGFESPYFVNKVQVLNHKWLIADFSDGDRWGELLVRYDVSDYDSIVYETRESLVYPKQ